jgi:hypothetical protein
MQDRQNYFVYNDHSLTTLSFPQFSLSSGHIQIDQNEGHEYIMKVK